MASLLMNAIAAWWERMCQTHSAWKIELAITAIVQLIGFWIPCTLYLLIDLLFPTFSKSHKIQPDPRRQPTLKQIKTCVRHATVVAFGDIAVQVFFGYITDFRPIFAITASLPSPREFARHWIFAHLVREILAYYIHRVFHHPRLYTRFHKKHHSFTAPIAFAAFYTTVTEHFFADVIPIVLPPALVSYYYEPIHILSFMSFLLSILLVGTAEHSGYDFAQPPVAKTHDLHHEKFTVNYGTLHFMDWVHGTNIDGWNWSLQLIKKVEILKVKTGGTMK